MTEGYQNIFVCCGSFINMQDPQLGKLWLKIDGTIVKDHKIEAYTFGIILTNVQRILNVIKDKKYPTLSDDSFRVFITNYEENSVVTAYQPIFPMENLDGLNTFNELAQEFKDIITILSDNIEDIRRNLDDRFEDPIQILRLLEGLKNILSKKSKYKIEINFGYQKPLDYIRVPSNKEGLIQDLIKEYTEKSQSREYGVIRSIISEYPQHFVLKTIEDKKITCYYKPDIEGKISDNFKMPVFVKGIVKKTPRKIEMEQIYDFKSFDFHTIQNAGEFEFIKPLTLKVKYQKETNRWNLINDELSINSFGKTFSDAIDEVTFSIEALVVAYLKFSDDKLSSESLRIKKILKNYLEIETYHNIFEDMVSDD